MGEFSTDRVPTVSLRVIDTAGETHFWTAMIDTGFTGWVSLVRETILTLNLPFLEYRAYELADNSEVVFELYEAKVVWVGQERVVSVVASDGMPTIGMSLLYGYRLTIDAIDGGSVLVEKL